MYTLFFFIQVRSLDLSQVRPNLAAAKSALLGLLDGTNRHKEEVKAAMRVYTDEGFRMCPIEEDLDIFMENVRLCNSISNLDNSIHKKAV